MKKDTFYFTHDYNARTDEKIKRLIRKHGMAGYGIFWAIIEDLYNNANALQTDCDSIAYELRTDVSVVKSVIFDFDLFVIDGEQFGSSSVERRLEERANVSKKAKASANARWAKIRNANAQETDANALPPHSERNAIKEKKEMKGKEKKESNGFQPDFDSLPLWMVEPLKIWFDYKKEKKSKYLPVGWNALVKKVEHEFTNETELMEAVNNSMSNNWQGIFKSKKADSLPLTDNLPPMDYTKTF